MKRVNKSKILILGLIVYLFFYVVVFFIGRNTNLLTVESHEFELRYSVKGKIEKDPTSLNTFLTTHVDDKSIKRYEQGQNLEIDYEGVNFDAVIYKVYQSTGKNLLKLKINAINDKNVINDNTREQEFDIIYKQIDCFRIPKTSIKLKKNKQGVFVIDEENQRAKFKYLDNIIYEDDNYIYIDYYKNETEKADTVKLHNRIILKPNSINTNIRIK